VLALLMENVYHATVIIRFVILNVVILDSIKETTPLDVTALLIVNVNLVIVK
jgi:hypothetical protein